MQLLYKGMTWGVLYMCESDDSNKAYSIWAPSVILYYSVYSVDASWYAGIVALHRESDDDFSSWRSRCLGRRSLERFRIAFSIEFLELRRANGLAD